MGCLTEEPSFVIHGSSLSMKGMSLYLLSATAHCFTAWSRISRERRWAKSSTAVLDDPPDFSWVSAGLSMLHPLAYLLTSLLPSSRMVCGKGFLDLMHPMVQLQEEFKLACTLSLEVVLKNGTEWCRFLAGRGESNCLSQYLWKEHFAWQGLDSYLS